MRGFTRLLCIVGFFLNGAGIFVASAEAGAACFDVCAPSVPAYSAFYTIGCLLPGLLVSGLGWAVNLILLAQEERWWRVGIALVALPICAVGSVLALLTANSGQLFPGSESDITRWERSLTPVLILVLCWPVITFLSSIALPRQASPDAPVSGG